MSLDLTSAPGMSGRRDAASLAPGAPLDVATAKPRRRPLRVALAIVILIAAVQVAVFLVTNPRFEWEVVGQYIFAPSVLSGLTMTIVLAVVCMIFGSLLGVGIAAGQLSEFGPIRWTCQFYVTVFRSIPMLVQLLFWYNLAYLLPTVGIGIPFMTPFVEWPTVTLISPLTAAVVGLSLHEASYMAEIVRGSVQSVDTGQTDAARAMGFSRGQSFVKIVLPQAMRVILPPAGSQFIGLIKGTSLVSVIAMSDLLFSVQSVYNQNYKVVPLLMVAVVWYFVLVTLLSIGQRGLERKFGRGYSRSSSGKKKAPVFTTSAQEA